MRVFPFLSKVPKYKRFHFEPRYYDPIKEERDQRIAGIRNEVLQERARRGEKVEVDNDIKGRLHKGYLRTSRTKAEPVMDQSSMTRVILMVVIGGSLYGWIEFGSIALYIGGAAFALFLYLRIRRG